MREKAENVGNKGNEVTTKQPRLSIRKISGDVVVWNVFRNVSFELLPIFITIDNIPLNNCHLMIIFLVNKDEKIIMYLFIEYVATSMDKLVNIY